MTDDLVPLRLVPVEVFGTQHYGISDAVSAWSDCNRAIGRIFRVDNVDPQYRNPDEIIHILVPESELPKLLEKRWGEEFDGGSPEVPTLVEKRWSEEFGA